MLTGKSLTGQVAIVTGASRGIGKAVAQALAAEGATVIINYNGSAEAAEAVAADIRSQGGMAEAVKCNVADFAESEAFVKAVTEKYGRVDTVSYTHLDVYKRQILFSEESVTEERVTVASQHILEVTGELIHIGMDVGISEEKGETERCV